MTRLKHYLGGEAVLSISADIRRAHRRFGQVSFIRQATQGLAQLELFDRARHIASCLRESLPRDFRKALRILVDSLGPPLSRPGYGSYVNLKVLPLTVFVSTFGMNTPIPSLNALREMTRRFTAEFDIRPFIVTHQELALRRLKSWTADGDVHVRRLCSEGARPRLPWATRLRCFVVDPGPLMSLLNLLKDDPEPYVQKSVGNAVADIIKDNPELGYRMLSEWMEAPTAYRCEIARFALRRQVLHCRKARAIADTAVSMGVRIREAVCQSPGDVGT